MSEAPAWIVGPPSRVGGPMRVMSSAAEVAEPRIVTSAPVGTVRFEYSTVLSAPSGRFTTLVPSGNVT